MYGTQHMRINGGSSATENVMPAGGLLIWRRSACRVRGQHLLSCVRAARAQRATRAYLGRESVPQQRALTTGGSSAAMTRAGLSKDCHWQKARHGPVHIDDSATGTVQVQHACCETTWRTKYFLHFLPQLFLSRKQKHFSKERSAEPLAP